VVSGAVDEHKAFPSYVLGVPSTILSMQYILSVPSHVTSLKALLPTHFCLNKMIDGYSNSQAGNA
jgi:hypothetical protein